MKLYNSIGPNPKAVRMVFEEKDLKADLIPIDLVGGENRRDPYLTKNPYAGLPLIELDTGQCISEVPVIVEFIEELHPSPPLIGASASERAHTRMWFRRIELTILAPMVAGFRYSEGLTLFQSRMRCIPQAADELKLTAREGIAFLNEQMNDRKFVGGNTFTIADIMLYAFLNFFDKAGQPFDRKLAAISRWYEETGDRESAKA